MAPGDYKCFLCGHTLMTKSGLSRHIVSKHTTDRRYECPYENCSYKANAKFVLDEHIRIHTNERPYQCGLCKTTFRASGNHYTHVKMCLKKHNAQSGQNITPLSLKSVERITTKSNNPDKLVHAVSNEQFGQKSKLSGHKKQHSTGETLEDYRVRSSGKLFSCKICLKTFSGKSNYKSHKLAHEERLKGNSVQKENVVHSSTSLMKSANRDCNVWQCTGCCENFQSRKRLRRHVTKHGHDKLVSKEGVTRNNINNENGNKDGIKESSLHKETLLQSSTHSEKSQSKNVMKHSWECTECHKKCKSKTRLARHVVKHGHDNGNTKTKSISPKAATVENTRWRCTNCHKDFKSLQKLKKHAIGAIILCVQNKEKRGAKKHSKITLLNVLCVRNTAKMKSGWQNI